MAQAVTIAGASYSDVPGLLIPKTGGGTAYFADTSPTTATDADVASGKIYFKADGSQSTGTASGGGSIVISDTTDASGGTIRTITATAVSMQSKTGINPTTSSQTIEPDNGYTGLSSVQINAMPSGTVTAPSTISGTGASVSTSTNTITLTKTVSVTPTVSTNGYVSSGTAGNSSVTLSASVTTKGATTYHPSTSDQTIASGTYTTATHTIKAVTLENLTADNIKSGVVVKVGDSTDDDCVTAVTGTYSGGGGSVSTDTKTVTASNYPVSLDFTGMKGQPKMFTVRLDAQVSSSGNTTYYYIVDITSHGTTTHGNCFRVGGTRRVDNITSGYSWSYSGTTLTITSSAASRSASPGAFYSGSYELMYVY